MSDSNPEKNVRSRLTIKNVRLPPEAYSSLDYVKPSQDKQDKLPLVDLKYVHLAPSSSNPSSSIVEVRISPSATLSTDDPPFNNSKPFSSFCNDISPNSQSQPESHPDSQLAAFVIRT
ncbi:uncharacterized protein UTRI_06667_B [Ustilago trichophora]|uniref:Uncharacterized protein n=1 Tax=Ustilago trichophora TaxID=86804 RepID=A0A5C3EMT4_9BASI|nr:uncharacterized protein UTRI_06667_B [Ustilago trichophora]